MAEDVKLTPLQKHVIFENGTEPPFVNKYWNLKEEGIYVDAISRIPLFASIHKFDSGSGWPSFFETINLEEIEEKEDFTARIEVRGKTAGSHLGHLFFDGPQEKGGKRYCINSASLDFVERSDMARQGYEALLKLFSKNESIILAGGCFWGLEDLLSKLNGVMQTRVGYCGGFTKNPKYEDVKTGSTGHAESVEVLFNPLNLSLEELLKFFFRIHDPTTINKQGNDIGSQYRSAIFYFTQAQKNIAENVILKGNLSGVFGTEIVTEVKEVDVFYQAEEYHQKYLQKHPEGYTCHFIRKNCTF